MENKIRIKVDERDLRLSIPSENGTIIINNPTQDFRKKSVGVIVDLMTEKKDFDEKQMMLDLINHCTNVEFDGDLFEATNLSHEAQMISNEILIIFQEIIAEAYQLLQLAMHQVKGEMLQNEILKEKEDALKINEEIQEQKKENATKITKINEKKNIKKPGRRAYR